MEKRELDVGGHPKTRLCSDVISMKSENRILDDIIHQLKDHADEQGVDALTLVEKLVKCSKVRWNKASNKEISSTSMPVENACAMIYNVNVSSQQYQQIGDLLKDYDMHLPTRNEVN